MREIFTLLFTLQYTEASGQQPATSGRGPTITPTTHSFSMHTITVKPPRRIRYIVINTINDISPYCQVFCSLYFFSYWIEGSLARSTGDLFSDVDLHVVVVTEEV